MVPFHKFSEFVADLAHGVHHLGVDDLKIMLTNDTPTGAEKDAAEVAEIGAHNGYPQGGALVTVVSSAQWRGVYSLVAGGVLFTASGVWDAFRYAVLYNATAGRLIGWWDYGESIRLHYGETFRVVADAEGLFQLS